MKKLLFAFLLMAGTVSAQYKTESGISYYPEKGDAYRNERCILDLYHPEKSGFSTIIWFHGGGLTGGNKEIPKALKDKGVAVVGVGYRLSPKAKVADIIRDAAAAVAWTVQNIERYGGDKSKIFLSGHSAGGYLDLMLALDKQYLGAYQINPQSLAGVIPFSAQCITHFTARKEQGIADTQPIIDALAPLYHVRKDAPPLLLITGDRELEMLGRYDENAYLARMLTLLGHPDHKLLELQGYDHGMADPAFPLLLREVNRLIKKTQP